jgi:hypothetical protein
LVRIGLDMLDEALADDRDAVLARAARVAAGDERVKRRAVPL